MALLTPMLFFALTLITAGVALHDDDLTSESVASFSHFQATPNTVAIDSANDPTSNDASNDSADSFVLPLSRHAFPKTGSTKANVHSRNSKRPTMPAYSSKWHLPRAHSFGGIAATAASSGSLVFASSNNKKRCITIKRPCGSTCSPDLRTIGLCSGGWKPKYCSKTKKLLIPCPASKVKMCTTTEKVRDVCEKKVKKKVRCPDKVGKRTVCSYPKVPVYSCENLPSNCAKLHKKKCRYRTTSEKAPCRKPTSPCNECLRKTAFQKCKANITRLVEVPCGASKTAGATPSTTPSPYPTPSGTSSKSGSNSTNQSPLPRSSSSPSASPAGEIDFFHEQGSYNPSSDNGFGGFDDFEHDHPNEDDGFEDPVANPVSVGDAQGHTRSVKCFASLFNEDDCKDAPPFCQLFDEAFDSDKCTREVCRECKLIKNVNVGPELRTYCRDLRASCHFLSRMVVPRMMQTATVVRSNVEKSEATKKCYRNETKAIVVPCNHPLPKTEVCLVGCRVGICEKIEKKRVSKYCRNHLPHKCYQTCKRKMVKRKVCHTLMERKRSGKVCKKDTKVKYKCYKKKTVKKPCKQEKGKLCSKLQKLQYVCGKVVSKLSKCSGLRGEKKCETKMCEQKRCF